MAHGHLARFGCILRDACAHWIGGCSGSLRESNILCRELFAIWKGLTLAWDSGFRQIKLLQRSANNVANLMAKHAASS
ncbi:hypothetical protein PIB30_065958 [Stylosanthes scabra]|uniref:RNase H type-1 domain-containing protein n=1 Tax=Stylosanthes scabra TaxID=79078 RepID=A0ABU6SNJ6_9FABA|nr:hypothetical protein [Stylosanthes scabra]